MQGLRLEVEGSVNRALKLSWAELVVARTRTVMRRERNGGVPTIFRCGNWGQDWEERETLRGFPGWKWVPSVSWHVGLRKGTGAGWGEVVLEAA